MDNNQNNIYEPTVIPRVPVPVRVLSIVSTVCGVMGIVFCWCYGSFIVASIAALVTSNIAKNKACDIEYGKYTTMIKTGKITGIIGIITNVLAFIIIIALIALGSIGILMDSGAL